MWKVLSIISAAISVAIIILPGIYIIYAKQNVFRWIKASYLAFLINYVRPMYPPRRYAPVAPPPHDHEDINGPLGPCENASVFMWCLLVATVVILRVEDEF